MSVTSFLTSKLARAFFASAGGNNADVYVDSFGKPYFFHRTRYEADLVNPVARERVLGLFLLDDDPIVKPGRWMEPEVARQFFRTLHHHDGVSDSLGKELLGSKLGERYKILGDMAAGPVNRHWDWRQCIFYVIDNESGKALMRIERFPVVGGEEA